MIEFLVKYHVFGFASLIGLLVAVAGFYFTLKTVLRTKRAAIRTQDIVNEVMENVSRIDTVSELSAALNAMDEIKSRFLKKDFNRLPERCNVIRKNLISIREAYRNRTPEQSAAIQGAITFLNRSENEFILLRENAKEPENVQFLTRILTNT
jgi:hypothetical protein